MKKVLTGIIAVGLTILISSLLLKHPGDVDTDAKTMRTVCDMTGRRVQTPVTVNRVVTAMYPVATQLMFLVGAQEFLAGVSSMDVNDVMLRIYPPISDVYQPGKTENGDITKEEIIRMRPDVVFTHTRNALINDYADLGIASISLKLETPEELIRGIELVGEVMNRSQRAAQIAGYYRDKLEYIREKTARIENRKKVYFAGPAMLSTAGGDFYQNFVIEYAGGVNVAGQGHGGWCSVSLEHLLSWNPDFVFIGNYGTACVDDFTKDPRLRGVTAVRNGDVYMSRSYIGSWDIPTPESLLGIMWLANKLYPRETAFDMAAEMIEFYRVCYGYTPARDEIAAVLEAP
jgi:iron complex transport system substrate-binding protein